MAYSVWPLDPDILKPNPLMVSACCKLIIQNKIFIRRNVPEQRARFDKIFIVRNVMNFHQQWRSSSKPLRAAHHTAGEGFLQYLTNKTNVQFMQLQKKMTNSHKQIHKCTQTNKLEDCDHTRETALAHWPLSISHINTSTTQIQLQLKTQMRT